MAWWNKKNTRNTGNGGGQSSPDAPSIDVNADIHDTSATCYNKTVSLTSALDLEVRSKGTNEWQDGEAFGLPPTLWQDIGDAVAMRRYYGVCVWLNGRVHPSRGVVVDYNGEKITVKIDGKNFDDARVSTLSKTGLVLGVKKANSNVVSTEKRLLEIANQTIEEFVKFGRIVSVSKDAPKSYMETVKETISQVRQGQDLVLRDDTLITRFNDETLQECLPPDTLRSLRQGVCGAWQVPYDLIYVDSSNRATAALARDSFLRDTLYPDACCVCAAFGDFGLDKVEEIRPKRLAAQEVAGKESKAAKEGEANEE